VAELLSLAMMGVKGACRSYNEGKTLMRHGYLALMFVAAVTACGGNRPASPIAVMRPTDGQQTCDKIDDEIAANEAAVNARRAEIDQAQSARTYNALAGGLIGAATSEDGSAARVEIDAYTQRIAYVRGISRKLKC